VAAELFLLDGRAPRAGTIFRNAALAATLERIAAGGRDAFYTGELAAVIAADVRHRGGFLTAEDLAAHRTDWVDPISTTYRGWRLYEMPPNTQGFVALEMLNILEGYDVAALGHNTAEYLHRFVEAKRAAFADRAAYLADPDHVPPATLATLISKTHAAERRHDVDRLVAATSLDRHRGDTVYLAAADGEGNAISLINSLFASFGSGVVVPGTGIVLHNRGSGFTLEKGHPNRLAPGKRPLHTLVPAFLVKDGEALMPFGVMGGDNQAQGHVQIVANIVDFGMGIQEAGEAPRVRHLGHALAVESGVSQAVRAELTRRGHAIADGRGMVGGYQAVMIDPRTGVLTAASDPRKDGLAIGW
jgi:gamma-glutamyltranspeptidase/glutathione hydrolase